MRRVIDRSPLVERIFELIFQKQSRKNHLELISCEESPRACVFAMTEV